MMPRAARKLSRRSVRRRFRWSSLDDLLRPILGPLEQSNQDPTDQPVHEDVALHKLQEDSYRNYRTQIGVGPTAGMARSTLDRPCPSHGQTFNNH